MSEIFDDYPIKGSTKQYGTPTPDNPQPIYNDGVLITHEPLKRGDRLIKKDGEYCVVKMPRVGKFEKVPYEQFKHDLIKTLEIEYATDEMIKDLYDNIKLPKRGTVDSAGYDFFAPFDFFVNKKDPVVIPTGIRAKIDTGWWLMMLPRSGSGFKYKVQLHNTAGVIDGDYYNADNYGHIMIKLTAEKLCHFNKGDGFCQGIFTVYGVTYDDEVEGIRTGGFGSTDVENNQ